MSPAVRAVAVALLLLLAGCEAGDADGGDEAGDAPQPVEQPEPADDASPADAPTPTPAPADEPVEVVAEATITGLEVPWEIAWAGGDAFVTERDRGRLLSVDLDAGEARQVDRFDIDPAGEGGLLGLAAHPDEPGTLYAYYSSAPHGDNRVVRFAPGAADDAEVIVDGIPHARIHNGGRIAFGPDDHLWISTGDAGQPARAQDETSLGGAILRVTADGDVPDGNPFGNEVYATGIRNTQGLAWTADGDLIAAEFGPDADDEINVIEAGANYGWPDVTGQAGVAAFTDPIFVEQPPAASWSGGEVLTDGAVPQWEGDAFVAALRGERLWRLELAGDDDGRPRVANAEQVLVGEYGRLRQAAQGPDGNLWLLTSNRDGRGSPASDDDRIIRLGPAQ